MGAYLLKFHTMPIIDDPGRQSKKNFWNVSEISLSRREHPVKKLFTATVKISRSEKFIITVKIFHAVNNFSHREI